MGHYVEKTELRRFIQESQARGQLTDELVAVLTRIIVGFGQKFKMHVDDDMVQDYLVNAMGFMWRLDASKNPFCYLTTCARNVLNYHYSRKKRERTMHETHFKNLAESERRRHRYRK